MDLIKKFLLAMAIHAVILLSGLGIVLYLGSHPEIFVMRPEGVPEDAVWHGGSKVSYWFELVEVNNEVYRFRVYVGQNGRLLLDDHFVLDEDCKDMKFNREQLLENILYYDSLIYITSENNLRCSLHPFVDSSRAIPDIDVNK